MVVLFNLNQTALNEALECALESGADFAELYFEKTRNRAVESTEGRIASIGDRWIKGVGLYMLRGTDSVYVYSNNITAASLINLAKKAGSLWEIKNGNRKAMPLKRMAPLQNPLNYAVPFSSVGYEDKIKLINKAGMVELNPVNIYRML